MIATMTVATRRRVVVLAFPDVQMLDVTGPSEVFSLAERFHGPAYELELVGVDRPGVANANAPPARDASPAQTAPPARDASPAQTAPIAASSGLRLLPDHRLATCRGPIDTLIVPGGVGVSAVQHDERLIAWIRAAAARSRRVASVCTGAFLLASAGLLDGRRATTHWNACAQLARRYPSIEVVPDPIFVRDGNVYTSAGVTAGIDLALALVEEDLGHRVALAVARSLVLFVRRPGGQAQFSAGLATGEAERASVRDLQRWLADHLNEDLTVPALAGRCFMSPRNFARVFAREVGLTPAVYVEALRLERARLLLESTELQVEEIAARCGYGTVETMRRGFARRLHVTPSEYRARFQTPSASVIPIRRQAP
jgi:transcriptional regulator GlxA family with amidase domain